MNNDRAPSADTVPGANAGPDAPSKAKRDQGEAGGDFPSRSQIVGKQEENMKSAKKNRRGASLDRDAHEAPSAGGLFGEGDVHAPTAEDAPMIESTPAGESGTLVDAYTLGTHPVPMIPTSAATRAADLIIAPPLPRGAPAPAVVDSAEAASKDGDGDTEMVSTELTEAATLIAKAFVKSGLGGGFEPLPAEKGDAYISRVYDQLMAKARNDGTVFNVANQWRNLARPCLSDIVDKAELKKWKNKKTVPKMKNAILKELEDVDALRLLAAGQPEKVTYIRGKIDIWWGKSKLEADTEIYRFAVETDAAAWLQSMRGGDAVCPNFLPKQQADGKLGPGSTWHGLFGARHVDAKDEEILRDPRVTQGPVLRKKVAYSERRHPTAAEIRKADVEEEEAKDAAIATRAADEAAELERLFRQRAATVGVTLERAPALDADRRTALLKWYAGMKK